MANQTDTNCNFEDYHNLSDIKLKCMHKFEDEFEMNAYKVISKIGIIICAFGIIGHLFSVIILSKKKFSKLSTYAYLLALSVCNEISLILAVIIFSDDLIPFIKLNISRNLVNNFKIFRIYIEPITVSCQALSVWISLAFTVDRYLYCCKPYFSGKYCTRKRASIVIILLYICASMYSIPQFFERSYEIVNVIDIPFVFPKITYLSMNYYYRAIFQIFFYSAFVVLIPFTIILILNVFLIYDIIKSNKRHHRLSLAFKTSENEKPGKKRKRSVLCKKSSSPTITTINQQNQRQESINETEHLNDPANNNDKSNTTRNRRHSIISNKSIFNIAEKTMRNDVTIMLIGLIVVFFICLTPSTILRLITYKRQNIIFEKLYTLFLDISNLLVVCNSTFNCIMYVMLGKKFREQFIKSFCPKIYKRKLKNYHSSLFTSYKNEKHFKFNNNNHTSNDVNFTV